MASADYTVSNEGSLFLLRANTDDSLEWLRRHVDDEAQWMGRAVAVEHRYITDLIEQLREDGFTVE